MKLFGIDFFKRPNILKKTTYMDCHRMVIEICKLPQIKEMLCEEQIKSLLEVGQSLIENVDNESFLKKHIREKAWNLYCDFSERTSNKVHKNNGYKYIPDKNAKIFIVLREIACSYSECTKNDKANYNYCRKVDGGYGFDENGYISKYKEACFLYKKIRSNI